MTECSVIVFREPETEYGYKCVCGKIGYGFDTRGRARIGASAHLWHSKQDASRRAMQTDLAAATAKLKRLMLWAEAHAKNAAPVANLPYEHERAYAIGFGNAASDVYEILTDP